MWNELIYPSLNLNSAAVEVKEWISKLFHNLGRPSQDDILEFMPIPIATPGLLLYPYGHNITIPRGLQTFDDQRCIPSLELLVWIHCQCWDKMQLLNIAKSWSGIIIIFHFKTCYFYIFLIWNSCSLCELGPRQQEQLHILFIVYCLQ